MKLFAFIAYLLRLEGASTITNRVLSYRYDETEASALGEFVKSMQEKYPNAGINDIITLEIPLPEDEIIPS